MKENKKEKKVFTVAVIIIVILSLLLIISRDYGDYRKIKLRKNNKEIFSVSDLVVGDIKYSDTEEEIKKKLGNPKNEEEIENGIYKYKKLSYEGLELTLKENYDKYMLVKAEITSRKYKTSRNIRVKDRVLKVIRKYKVENSKGTYIYGNYTTKSLDNLQIKENIYLAVRNDKEIVYVYRDTVVLEERPNIARLNITYSKGKVEKIVWSYDTE